MGTNYYGIEENGNKVHIGKNSAGWWFGLDINNDKFDDYHSLVEWLQNNVNKVVNEYGDELTISEMKNTILQQDENGNVKEHPKGNSVSQRGDSFVKGQAVKNSVIRLINNDFV